MNRRFYLRRQGVVQRSERQDDDASSRHARWCYKERLQDEAKWKAQDALKDTSVTENESRSDAWRVR
ncbi:hypothetical protein KCP70_06160 [Salmonella enterica subsp. enterica]|nr:hypothetical protein KCP70_06160 [Salmonella enterica subsp. enterica]